MERTLGPRRSSCLRFQLFSVEMCSFLPDDESDRRNLSCQGEASHRRLHAFGEQALVEIVERSLPAAGHGRCTLEDGFHIMIVILIQPTNLLGLLRTMFTFTGIPSQKRFDRFHFMEEVWMSVSGARSSTTSSGINPQRWGEGTYRPRGTPASAYGNTSQPRFRRGRARRPRHDSPGQSR